MNKRVVLSILILFFIKLHGSYSLPLIKPDESLTDIEHKLLAFAKINGGAAIKTMLTKLDIDLADEHLPTLNQALAVETSTGNGVKGEKKAVVASDKDEKKIAGEKLAKQKAHDGKQLSSSSENRVAENDETRYIEERDRERVLHDERVSSDKNSSSLRHHGSQIDDVKQSLIKKPVENGGDSAVKPKLFIKTPQLASSEGPKESDREHETSHVVIDRDQQRNRNVELEYEHDVTAGDAEKHGNPVERLTINAAGAGADVHKSKKGEIIKVKPNEMIERPVMFGKRKHGLTIEHSGEQPSETLTPDAKLKDEVIEAAKESTKVPTLDSIVPHESRDSRNVGIQTIKDSAKATTTIEPNALHDSRDIRSGEEPQHSPLSPPGRDHENDPVRRVKHEGNAVDAVIQQVRLSPSPPEISTDHDVRFSLMRNGRDNEPSSHNDNQHSKSFDVKKESQAEPLQAHIQPAPLVASAPILPVLPVVAAQQVSPVVTTPYDLTMPVSAFYGFQGIQ